VRIRRSCRLTRLCPHRRADLAPPGPTLFLTKHALSKVGNLLRSNDLYSFSLFSEKLFYGPQMVSEATYGLLNTGFLVAFSLSPSPSLPVFKES
jgi:hypothetical protein